MRLRLFNRGHGVLHAEIPAQVKGRFAIFERFGNSFLKHGGRRHRDYHEATSSLFKGSCSWRDPRGFRARLKSRLGQKKCHEGRLRWVLCSEDLALRFASISQGTDALSTSLQIETPRLMRYGKGSLRCL